MVTETDEDPDRGEKFAYGYSLAKKYWRGLPRATFDSYARAKALLYLEWEDMVGEQTDDAALIARYYQQNYGMVFYHLRAIGPPDSWCADHHRANITMRAIPTTGGRTILDIGTGAGSVPLWLARRGFAAAFQELGQTYHFARWRMAREGFLSPTVEAGKVTAFDDIDAALAAVEGGWDAISALDVLEHIPDAVSALKRWVAALREGGVLIITHHAFKKHVTHLPETFWLQEKLPDVLGGLGLRFIQGPDSFYGIGAWMKEAEG